MFKLEHNGVHVTLHAYLTSNAGLALLSIAGPQEAVRASIATALAGHELFIYTQEREAAPWTWHRWLSNNPTTHYHTLIKKLPSGQLHGVLFQSSATTRSVTPAFTLLLPLSDATHATSNFIRMLNTRTSLPLHPSWADHIWQIFLEEHWIEALTGEGSWTGWDVQWDPEILQARITHAIAAGQLTLSS